MSDYKSTKNEDLSSRGCLNKKSHTKHGHSRKQKTTPTYSTWKSTCNRCANPKNRQYRFYGGRGISVCERWKNFENFLEDMGEKPPGTSIDRFPDKNGNYEKSNCRWATQKQQCRNTRRNRIIEFNGESRCLSEWSEILGIHIMTLENRLNRMSIEKAFTTKVQRLRLVTFNGETRCLRDWSDILGIGYITLSTRLSHGWSVERTLTTKVGSYTKHP